MVEMIEKHINLKARGLPIRIDVVQGTNAVPIKFTLMDYDIPAGAEARIYIRKPSGLEIYNNCTIEENNVIVQPTMQMYAEKGRAKAQLQIVADDVVAASFAFCIDVAENIASSSAIESSNEFGILDVLIDEAREAIAALVKLKPHAFVTPVQNLTTTVAGSALDATMGKTIKDEIDEIKGHIGYTDEEIVGVQVDFANKACTRIAGAANLTAGADFDKFKMYGGRKRCNVADDGTIAAWYGDAGYKEDGSNGQVMVYQPKFFYRVVPIKIEPIKEGIGYHLRKANYYVSEYPLAGLKLHPAFYDAQGNEIDYILMGAYEGSIFDVSANAYILDDAQVMDYANDLFCSIAGAKPASGKTQNLTRPNVNQMCMNRGAGWYSDNTKATSANQMLMIIEMGMMNMQTAIGQGVVSVADNPNTENNSKVTGGTSALGNETGRASGTSGQVSVSYRGYENPWGNIWKFIYGVNIWGDGTLGGGVPYYATDFNFAESKRTDNYVSAGFSITNSEGYVSAIGYAPECDWMFIASECLGNSSVPVGDYQRINVNLNGYMVALLGGHWSNASYAGAFYWSLNNSVGNRNRYFSGRLVYVPTAS